MTKKKINLLTAGLFNTVGEKDVLREIAPGKLVFQDRLLSTAERNDLIGQARTLKVLSLHNILLDEIRFLCNKKMYIDSKDERDILAGKMGLWFVEQFKLKINWLAGMKVDKGAGRP